MCNNKLSENECSHLSGLYLAGIVLPVVITSHKTLTGMTCIPNNHTHTIWCICTWVHNAIGHSFFYFLKEFDININFYNFSKHVNYNPFNKIIEKREEAFRKVKKNTPIKLKENSNNAAIRGQTEN